MTYALFVAHLELKYALVVNDITLYLMLMASIFIVLNDCFQNLVLFFKIILLIFALILVIIGSISYGFIRQKQRNFQDVPLIECDNEPVDVIEQEQKVESIPLALPCVIEISPGQPIDNPSELVPVIVSIQVAVKKVISEESLRQLSCYCDGSYSHQSQTGFSGFLTSDGFSKFRHCPLRRPRSGSTESEVFAACLSLQYTAKNQYDKLILYTDNSKVEQLLKRPKKKDYNAYPDFFHALKECHKKKDHFHILVERVRGHTTWFEQQQCSKKRAFATVDKQVRQKRQRYEQKNDINHPSHNNYSYKCNGRYIRVIHADKFGDTLIITSSRRTS